MRLLDVCRFAHYFACMQRKLFLQQALLPDGWHDDVLVEVGATGLIESVRADVDEAQANRSGAERVHGVVVPGVGNAHSHAHQRAIVGLTEHSSAGTDSFWTWREAMYRCAARIGPDQLEAIAAQAYVEMLRSGYTSVAEFQYLHHAADGTPYDNRAEMTLRCAAAAHTTGIGFTALPVLYSFGGFGGVPASGTQLRFANDEDGFGRLLELVAAACGVPNGHAFGMALHSLRAVRGESIQTTVEQLHARHDGAPVHIHIAEQLGEVEDCQRWSGGKRPIEWLLEHAGVDSRWNLVHATHATDAEVRAVAKARATVVLCPTTEANLGDGIFDALSYLSAGGRIAIGSDSQSTICPAQELRLLEYGQRLMRHERNVLAGGAHRSTARALLDHVLASGASAMGRAAAAIAVGMRADLVALDREHPMLVERSADECLAAWMFSAGQACVRDVFVGGVQLINNGQHAAQESVLERYRRALRTLAT
jgi:formimidoylglutamate deiminase